MLRFVYHEDIIGEDIWDSMFRHRAIQFQDRLGWDVKVNENGHERDEYDELNPLYVIWQRPDGSHGGSMRILPTTAETMIGDHFTALTGGVRLASPLIWECTRFCLAPDADRRMSARIMLGVHELGVDCILDHVVGVFDVCMQRVYGRTGWEPEIIGQAEYDGSSILAGFWSFSENFRNKLEKRSQIKPGDCKRWLDDSFRKVGIGPHPSEAAGHHVDA